MKKLATLTLMILFAFAPVAYAQDATTDASGSSTTPASADTAAPSTGTPSSDTTQTAPDLAAAPDATQPSTSDTSATVTTAPASETPSAPDTASNDSASSTDVTVQDTANTQTTVTGDELENTSNPQASTSTSDASSIIEVDASSTDTVTVAPDDAATSTATSTDPAVPEGAATSTDATSTSATDASSTPATSSASGQSVTIPDDRSLDVVAQDVEQTQAPTADQPSQPRQSAPIKLSTKDLAPKPEYAFAIKTGTIPVDGKDASATSSPLTASADNASGTIKVSGSCSDAYFVVLLFKNKDDYASDPSSYILNQAYPCVNNAFSYSITELPPSLDNGTYYLLIGQEGDRGTWKPITDLTPITINKN